MDFPKFVWMLEHKALYFARADLLGDSHEGALPDFDIEERASRMGDNIEWAPGLSGPEDLGKLMVRATYISCWNASPVESAALWNLYGGGVAIRSTYAKLRDCFICAEPVHIGMVEYIDYRADRIDRSDTISPLLRKRRYFEHENEIRAVIAGNWTEEEGDRWRWAHEDPRHGIAADIDLDRLMTEVRIAPGDEILGDVVPAIAERYGLAADISQSSLDDPPQY